MATVMLTIKLPEELRRRTKAVAALRGETISDIVREALQNYTAEAMEEADDVSAIHEIEARIQRGEEPISAWDEFEAELDALPH
jgi:predicted DNA-binding protein